MRLVTSMRDVAIDLTLARGGDQAVIKTAAESLILAVEEQTTKNTV